MDDIKDNPAILKKYILVPTYYVDNTDYLVALFPEHYPVELSGLPANRKPMVLAVYKPTPRGGYFKNGKGEVCREYEYVGVRIV